MFDHVKYAYNTRIILYNRPRRSITWRETIQAVNRQPLRGYDYEYRPRAAIEHHISGFSFFLSRKTGHISKLWKFNRSKYLERLAFRYLGKQIPGTWYLIGKSGNTKKNARNM